jgi:ectoine hydroxylase
MPAPRAVNVLVNLDDVTEFNGPMYFVPGSHREGCIDLATGSRGAAGDWRENVRADLKYRIQAEMLGGLVKRYGMVAPKGSAGSALFFDSNVVHGSPPNISPFHRRVIIVTYNAVDNVPVSQGPQRPDFLVSRDYRPLSPVATLGPPR